MTLFLQVLRKRKIQRFFLALSLCFQDFLFPSVAVKDFEPLSSTEPGTGLLRMLPLVEISFLCALGNVRAQSSQGEHMLPLAESFSYGLCPGDAFRYLTPMSSCRNTGSLPLLLAHPLPWSHNLQPIMPALW